MFLLCNSCRSPHVETAVKHHIRTISSHSQKEKKIFWILVLVCKLLLLVFLKKWKEFLVVVDKRKMLHIHFNIVPCVTEKAFSLFKKRERMQIYYSSLL